jgi:1-acyl-sn-glycerol-3-phosphate acyltransferase
MLIKYLRLIFALASAFFIVWLKFPSASREQKLDYIREWSSKALDVMKIRVHISMAPPTIDVRPTQLLVANHVSWLDVLVIQSIQPSVFIAKSEVRYWPLIGHLAKACGVIFVDRSSPSSAKKMVRDVTVALQSGYRVAGFPEGTSSEGHDVSLFHANLFEAAIDHTTPVMPIALRYTSPETKDLCLKAAFVGEIGFMASLHQILTEKSINVGVKYGEVLLPHGHSRRTLAHLSHQSVTHQLISLQT